MDIKVNEINMSNVNNYNSTNNQVDKAFHFTLVSKIEEDELKYKLNNLINEISEQGEKISKNMDVKDMRQYRVLIKDFFNEVVSRSHEFSRDNFLDRRGRHRVYGIVKLVDENLDQLANELLEIEKNHIKILERVDEIRGLILDVIT